MKSEYIPKILYDRGFLDVSFTGDENSPNARFFSSGRYKYTLKLFDASRKDRISSVLRFQKSIHDNGFPCPNPVTVSRDLVFPVEDKYAAVLEFLEGATLKSPKARDFFEMGKMLGVYHNYSEGRKLDGNIKEFDADFFYSLLQDKKIPEELMPTFRRLENSLKNRNYRKSVYGVAHGDSHHGNFLFRGSGPSGIIDFENAYSGNLMHDLGDLVFWSRRVSENDFGEVVSAIREGYSESRPGFIDSKEDLLLRARDKAVLNSFWKLWRVFRKREKLDSLVNSLNSLDFMESMLKDGK